MPACHTCNLAVLPDSCAVRNRRVVCVCYFVMIKLSLAVALMAYVVLCLLFCYDQVVFGGCVNGVRCRSHARRAVGGTVCAADDAYSGQAWRPGPCIGPPRGGALERVQFAMAEQVWAGLLRARCCAASAVWVLLAQWFAFCCSCVGGAAVSRLSGVRSITESMDVAW